MPIDLRWLIQDEVIFVRVEGGISMDEIRLKSGRLTEILDAAVRPISFIVDVRHVGYFPTEEEQLLPYREALMHEKMGWITIYGNPLLTSLASRQMKHMPGMRLLVTTHYITALEELMARGVAMEEGRLLTEANGHITTLRV